MEITHPNVGLSMFLFSLLHNFSVGDKIVMTPNRAVAIWLASFAPTPPNDAWRSSSPSSIGGGAFLRPSPPPSSSSSSSSFRPPVVRYYSPSPPPPPRRRGLVRRRPRSSSRGRGQHTIHVAHLSTIKDDFDDYDDDDDGGSKGGFFIAFVGDERISIERIALDDVDGLERMSEFCVSGFYDDDDDDDDAGDDGSTFSR